MRGATAHTVILYGKADCCLCWEVSDLLDRLRQEYRLTVQEVDITADITLYERYKHTIPVVVVDERLTLSAPIGEADLRRAFNELNDQR